MLPQHRAQLLCRGPPTRPVANAGSGSMRPHSATSLHRACCKVAHSCLPRVHVQSIMDDGASLATCHLVFQHSVHSPDAAKDRARRLKALTQPETAHAIAEGDGHDAGLPDNCLRLPPPAILKTAAMHADSALASVRGGSCDAPRDGPCAGFLQLTVVASPCACVFACDVNRLQCPPTLCSS